MNERDDIHIGQPVQIPADSHIGNFEPLGQLADIDGFSFLQFLQEKVTAFTGIHCYLHI